MFPFISRIECMGGGVSKGTGPWVPAPLLLPQEFERVVPWNTPFLLPLGAQAACKGGEESADLTSVSGCRSPEVVSDS